MAIMFHKDNTPGPGSFIQVRASGRPIGRIFHTAGVHQFFTGDEPKLHGPELQDEDLDRLKDKILSRYGEA